MSGGKIIVFMDYTGSNPGCSFCRLINDRIWLKILEEARQALRNKGFEDILFLDNITGSPIVVS